MCVGVLAARYARGLPEPCPSKTEGAGNAGCTLHPRSRVQKHMEKRTRAYRYSRNTPAFPAQWLDGLRLGAIFQRTPSGDGRVLAECILAALSDSDCAA